MRHNTLSIQRATILPRLSAFKSFSLFFAVLLLCGCKGEKNIVTYESLYKELPTTMMVAPVQDNSARIVQKTTQDEVLNNELDAAAHFMRQAPTEALVAQGYYVVAPLSADILLGKLGKNYRQLTQDDIKPLSTQYGIDALLLIAIHKWQEPECNEVVVFAEYTLRSTKTGQELMHTWVRGKKIQPVDAKCNPVELASDAQFMKLTGMDSPLAHRCILLQAMSDFVLRSLPTSANRWTFQKDQYYPANPNFYGFTILPDGSIERSEYNEDAFGNECFTN